LLEFAFDNFSTNEYIVMMMMKLNYINFLENMNWIIVSTQQLHKKRRRRWFCRVWRWIVMELICR